MSNLNEQQFGDAFEVGKPYKVTYQDKVGNRTTFKGTYKRFQENAIDLGYAKYHAHVFDVGGTEKRVRHDWTILHSEETSVGRRDKETMEKNRQALLGRIGTDWGAVPDGASASDIAHLEKHGHIESRVTERWDSVTNRQGLFGGYNTVKRKAKEVRRVR
jgi:hypothetical protein